MKKTNTLYPNLYNNEVVLLCYKKTETQKESILDEHSSFVI